MSSPSTDRTGQGSGPMLRMSAPSLIAVAVVVLAAAITVALLVIPPGAPPIASGSPSAEPTRTATPSPSATPTPEPSATPVPSASPAPTTAAPATWTGLAWSDPATPAFEVHLYDLEPWEGRYVAVGELGGGDGQGDAAFLTSPDGLDWTVTHRVSPGFGRIPRHLVTLGDELLAFSVPDTDSLPLGAAYGHLVWSSTDGATWTPLESPSWSAAWAGRQIGPMPAGWEVMHSEIETALVDVASGPAGLVAIGNSFGASGMDPVVLHSTDGRAWSSVSLPADSPSAMLASVEAYRDGFVMVGAVGVGPEVATSVAAGWFSPDGATWARATVTDLPSGSGGDEFGPLWAGADGLLTCRGNRGMGAGGWRHMSEWISSDGTTWQVDPQQDQSNGCDWSAADGTRIVSLAPRAHATPYAWPGVTRASVSTDGRTWADLAVSEVLTDPVERFWVVPDGVIYAGEQSFWFGRATAP